MPVETSAKPTILGSENYGLDRVLESLVLGDALKSLQVIVREIRFQRGEACLTEVVKGLLIDFFTRETEGE